MNLVTERYLMRYWKWMECISSNKTQEELCFRYQRAISREITPTRACEWRRKWQPTSVFLLGKFHGQRNLARLQSIGLQRVGHDWVHKHACIHIDTDSLQWGYWDGQCSIHDEKKWKWESLSGVWLFETSRTVAHQASLSIEFSRQEYWSG